MNCSVIHKYLSSIDALSAGERQPKNYGTGHLLYHSEINFIEVVHKFPHSNAISISKIMGVTRGAITQIGKQLEEKGLVERFSKADNKKEKYYSLTDLGKKCQKGHSDYHEDANRQICEYLGSLKKEEISIIVDFLDRLSNLPVSEFECTSGCTMSPK